MRRILFLALTAITLLGFSACRAEESQKPYYFFVYNSEKITDEDLTAICDLGEMYPDYEIVLSDVSGLTNAGEVYHFLQSERDARGTDPSAIQIFGVPHMVPAFVHRFEIEEFPTPDTSELLVLDNFVSDYFYSNFDNDPEELDRISSYRLSDKLGEVDILPHWPVVRLPLLRGQYAEFLEKYREYLSYREEDALVNISLASPIFPAGWYLVAADDDGYFLTRARDEWGMIENLHLYGTTEGVYPSALELEGSCDVEDWSYLTESKLCEIYHSSHGAEDSLFQTIFDGRGKDEYHCEAILTTYTVNRVLNGMPYFLNTCGCETAKSMTGNVITTALQGRCVGAIASTTFVSNVDVDCLLPEEDYDGGYTRYTLLYEYLHGKKMGLTRAEAFYAGQVQAAFSLVENMDVLHTHSVQSNLNNLLGFHNFGLVDP